MKQALIWHLISGWPHPGLNQKEETMSGQSHVIEALFPGAKYSNPSDYRSLVANYCKPALEKLFPELAKELDSRKISGTETVTMPKAILSSYDNGGYEWQEDREWAKKFNEWLGSTD